MSNGLKVLREVANLSDATTAQVAKYERAQPYFAQGYVDNDAIRDSAFTDELVAQGTGNFAVADKDGNVLHTFDNLAAAERARAGAKMALAIDLPETAAEA